MDEVRALCEMYELSDVTEESFNMVENPTGETMLPALVSTMANFRPVYHPVERDFTGVPTYPLLNQLTIPTFPHTDQLVYPEYMMVYTQSGLPVFQSPAENVNEYAMPYTEPKIDHSESKYSSIPCPAEMLNVVDHPSGPGPTERTIPRTLHITAPRRGRPPKHGTHSGPILLVNEKGRTMPKEKENLPFVKLQKGHCDLPFTSISSAKITRITEEDYNGDCEEMDMEFPELDAMDDDEKDRDYPKPPYSYSAMVTIALKNSKNGRMTVRDIYNFMCKHYPYFRTASAGWKNSVRHNLSLNPGFLKIFTESGPAKARTACRWAINPDRYAKLNEDVLKWHAKNLELIKRSMRDPELLSSLEKGSGVDFRLAVQGVTIQKKNLGNNRRKSSKSSLTGSDVTDNPDSPFMTCVDEFLEAANPTFKKGAGAAFSRATSHLRSYGELNGETGWGSVQLPESSTWKVSDERTATVHEAK
ncbi:forkhead box protein M1-like [Paramacrobiotus metropolitanus]|uniref:forkhead box protein M1-like n=1 Tax=Paramacrobiotus metropolitanus TaxID=2943436 RepID=UPI002445F4F5|nr:forkhead box protein M1-like [Paramacrobiotus metropolitanus]